VTGVAEKSPYKRIDLGQLDKIQQAERPTLRIRWWIVLPLAVLLSAAQAALNLHLENRPTGVTLIATQISVIAFAFLILLSLGLNPLLRLTRLMQPFNRGEMMTLYAALCVSAGISSYGLVDQLVPLIATPFNPEYATPQSGWTKDVTPYLNKALYITDMKGIQEYRQGFPSTEGLWRKVPWALWAKPLALWMIFVFAVYGVFYGLAMLLFDTWARREKLIFPLARLPEDLMSDEDAPCGTISSTLRSSLFWLGFLFVAVLLSYNACCQAGWLRGLTPLTLGFDQSKLQEMLSHSVFRGIADELGGGMYRVRILIIFTAIGIGFLIPLEISASIWIYYLVSVALFLLAIWTAAGATIRSFPSDWLWENNFVSALGAGGLLAYSAAALAKLAAERASAIRQAAAAQGRRLSAARWAAEVAASMGWGGLVFAASCAVAIGWLAWCHVSWYWGAGFMAVIVLVIVGLMRVVAEGGIYWFQVHTGPFHLVKTFGLTGSVPQSALTPLMPLYSVLFTDIKATMAPTVMNSFKMQEETRAARRWFHASVIAAIVVTVAVSFATLLYIVYGVGANRCSEWFFKLGPQSLLDSTQLLVSGGAAGTQPNNWIYYLIGAGWVLLSIGMRRRFFWWLHPIGFAMMANALIPAVSFSFFIGWCCKKLAVRYGGRHMFTRLRPAFIGLIFGELMACFVWSVVASTFALNKVSIDLDRF
jgi:hypothetical protein